MLTVLSLTLVLLAQSPPPAGSASGVYAELGITSIPRSAGELPKAYHADAISLESVRLQPASFPVRSAVLDAVAALGKLDKLPTGRELHHTQATDSGKSKLIERQENIAGMILSLDEAAESLRLAPNKFPMERSKRWLAHHAYVSAVVAMRLAYLDELNMAYASVRTSRLPDRNEAKGQTGWRLVPTEKMASKASVRKLDEDAREQLRKIVSDHPGTPWATLANDLLKTKPGLVWEAAAVPLPVPPKAKKPKKE